ncbi:hypothetical protein ACWD3J_16800 [Streptomyces sp. NPDC002755]
MTAFAETAALLAVMNRDDARARSIVADMFPNERAEFAEQLDRLRAMLGDRFGNDIGPSSTPRAQVLDGEECFLGRQLGGAS